MPLSPLLLSLSLAACGFSAPGGILVDSGATDTADDGGGEDGGGGGGGGSGGGGDDTTPPDPETVDDDGDGFSEVQGDCDDTRATVYPGAWDDCDGLDEDCDGELDEDAVDDDPYEPNDASSDAYGLGSVNDDPSQAIQAALHSDADVDRFRFTFEDSSWDWDFTLGVALSSIPSGARYGLRLENLRTGSVVYEQTGSSELRAEVTENLVADDGGEYEITIWAESGADCARRYLLSVDLE